MSDTQSTVDALHCLPLNRHSLRSPRDYHALEIRLELNNQLLSDLVEKCRSIVTSMRQFKVGSCCHRCRVNVEASIGRRSIHIMNTFSFTSITRVLSCNLFNRFDFNSLHVTMFRFFLLHLVPLRSLERSYTRCWCVSSIRICNKRHRMRSILCAIGEMLCSISWESCRNFACAVLSVCLSVFVEPAGPSTFCLHGSHSLPA